LQTNVVNAVVKMCVGALDAQDGVNPALTAPQNDLHDQCHAIAGAFVGSSAAGSSAAYQATALGALTQVSGNEISTQGALATRAVAGQFANISGRLTALRFGADSSFLAGGTAADDENSGWARGDALVADSAPFTAAEPTALLKTALLTDGSPQLARAESAGDTRSVNTASPVSNSPWGVFVQGSYTSGHHDITSDEDPFHFHAESVTGGVDYNFGSAVLGGSIGYDNFDSSFDNAGLTVSGGSAQVKSTSGSLYGAWFGEHWIFNGIATYGHLSTDVTRFVKYTAVYAANFDVQTDIKDNCTGTVCSVSVARTLQGNPDGHTEAAGVTGGYQFNAASVNIYPSLSVNYRRAVINSFTETDPNPPAGGDGLALSYNDQTVDSLRSILGVDLSLPISASFGVITPIVRLEWDHEYKTGARSIEARYYFDPTRLTTCLSCFSLPTDSSPANYGIAGAGVSVVLARRLQAFVYDEALIGYTDYRSNSVAIGVRGQF
jgi:uncharacterized protein YhjY with autotransporter beta-barrel domain